MKFVKINNKVIAVFIILLLNSAAALWITYCLQNYACFQQFANKNVFFLQCLRVILLTSNIIICIAAIFFIFKSERFSDLLKNFSLSFFSFLSYLFILEIVFMFVPQSHAVGYTLAHRIWQHYYWKPVNELGYRDDLVNLNITRAGIKILVVGDSFAAGHGIKNYNDRFSNVLQKKLPANARVYNMGVSGLDTAAEFEKMKKFPIKPDIIVLQYFFNDIDGRALQSGIGKRFNPFFTRYKELNKIQSFFIKNSYFLNFIYWQSPHDDYMSYYNFLIYSYADARTLKAHLEDLNNFVEYSKNNKIVLIVVIFPFLRNLIKDDSVESFFQSKNVAVINVADIARPLLWRKRVVNKIDVHPSVLVHRLTAEAIYDYLMENGLIAQLNIKN